MATNPNSLKALEKNRHKGQFSSENQPQNKGRNALEFVIREAVLRDNAEEMKAIVQGLIADARGYVGKNGRTVRNMDAVKILFEHGFSKPKGDDETGGGNYIINVINPFTTDPERIVETAKS